MTDGLYIMVNSCDLFETKMTKLGQELAKTLEMEFIIETTWTIHSY